MDKKKKGIDPKELFFGKVPPNAKDIESAVLGIMMVYAASIKKVKEVIEPADFYTEANQAICEAIFTISNKTSPDVQLVHQHLVDNGAIENIGGLYEINKMTVDVTSDTNIQHYCLVIKEKSVQRRLIEFGSHILSSVYKGDDDVFDTLLESEIKLRGLNFELEGLNQTSVAEIGMRVIRDFDNKVYKAKNNIVDENAIYTRFLQWDDINGTMFPGLYIVAGRPGMGKGVHMTELICRMGKEFPIGVINGEMTDEQLLRRIGCNLLSIDNFLFKKNPLYVTEVEQELLKEAMGEALNLKLHIESSRYINRISNKIKLWVDSYGVKCVMADFLTLFKVPYELEKYYTKTQQVDYILDIFTQLCKDLEIPIILYVQMNREILGRHGLKEPNLADLKQSGSIEELAYQVSFLHRPEYYDEKAIVDENGEDIKGLMYQIIAKHRDGKLGKLKYKANLACSKITDWNTTIFSPSPF